MFFTRVVKVSLFVCACPMHAFVKQAKTLKWTKTLPKAENLILPSLNLPDETKKVTKFFIFTSLCGTSKCFMKTIKKYSGE